MASVFYKPYTKFDRNFRRGCCNLVERTFYGNILFFVKASDFQAFSDYLDEMDVFVFFDIFSSVYAFVFVVSQGVYLRI